MLVRDTQTHREGHVKTETETEVCCYKTRTLGPPEAGKIKKGLKSSLEPSEGAWSC